MSARRTLAIGLDGYDPEVEAEMMRAGRMPRLAALRAQSACFQLDHGPAKRTGLGWEHVSMGRSPEDYRRWAVVHFDPRRYQAIQKGVAAPPFVAELPLRTVVFDSPYFDLARAPSCRGLVGWGAHDPGVDAICSPPSLAAEVEARFGRYPATPFIYGFCWPDAALAREMGAALARAVDVRAELTRWLLAERLPDWELALIAVSEAHSGLEGLWHGIDPSHPLHALPSAAPARDGVHAIYAAIDRLIGTLLDAFPDARVAVFSLHGMGANDSDVAGMLLLPELLYRRRFGGAWFTPRPDWASMPDGIPLLSPGERWSREVMNRLGDRARGRRSLRTVARDAWRKLGGRRRERELAAKYIDWMPASHYRRFWSQMDAFALPAYYEGQIRLNLVGRERRGRVPLAEYDARCDELCALLDECRDPRTGDPIVDHVARPVHGAPLSVHETQPDLAVYWKGTPLAFEHPRLGRIGPAPFRRTGGHTGGFGMAVLRGAELPPGDHGVRSAFDVAPTLLDWCGLDPAGVSGESLLRRPAASELSPD